MSLRAPNDEEIIADYDDPKCSECGSSDPCECDWPKCDNCDEHYEELNEHGYCDRCEAMFVERERLEEEQEREEEQYARDVKETDDAARRWFPFW